MKPMTPQPPPPPRTPEQIAAEHWLAIPAEIRKTIPVGLADVILARFTTALQSKQDEIDKLRTLADKYSEARVEWATEALKLRTRAERAEALVASSDRQDGAAGGEGEAVDTVTEVIELLRAIEQAERERDEERRLRNTAEELLKAERSHTDTLRHTVENMDSVWQERMREVWDVLKPLAAIADEPSMKTWPDATTLLDCRSLKHSINLGHFRKIRDLLNKFDKQYETQKTKTHPC